MIFDPLYIVITLPALLLVIYAQFKVKGTYKKYSEVRNTVNLTGGQVARLLLDRAGLREVPVETTEGALSDHYDPGKRVLRLSSGVYGVPSVAAIGIAAHEVGHAYQHQDQSYALMRLRAPLVPVANIGSQLGVWLAIIGFFVQASSMVMLGIVLFMGAVVFALVTLPIELNASRRALQALQANGLVSTVDLDGARSVLNAAALTYVAAMLQALLTLLYLVLRFAGMNRSEE